MKFQMKSKPNIMYYHAVIMEFVMVGVYLMVRGTFYTRLYQQKSEQLVGIISAHVSLGLNLHYQLSRYLSTKYIKICNVSLLSKADILFSKIASGFRPNSATLFNLLSHSTRFQFLVTLLNIISKAVTLQRKYNYAYSKIPRKVTTACSRTYLPVKKKTPRAPPRWNPITHCHSVTSHNNGLLRRTVLR